MALEARDVAEVDGLKLKGVDCVDDDTDWFEADLVDSTDTGGR